MPKWNRADFNRMMSSVRMHIIIDDDMKLHYHWSGGGRGIKNSGTSGGPPGVGEVYVRFDDGRRIDIRRVLSHQDRTTGRGWIDSEVRHTLNLIKKKVNP